MKDLEYLPTRLACADGRLRMVYVRGAWEKACWREEPLPDGRVPAYRRSSLGTGLDKRSAYIRGYVDTARVFHATQEEVTA